MFSTDNCILGFLSVLLQKVLEFFLTFRENFSGKRRLQRLVEFSQKYHSVRIRLYFKLFLIIDHLVFFLKMGKSRVLKHSLHILFKVKETVALRTTTVSSGIKLV